jgi:hypothetical protein
MPYHCGSRNQGAEATSTLAIPTVSRGAFTHR